MIALLLGPVLGFITSFAPELLKWLNKKADQKHELAMLEAQMKYADQLAQARLAEINATADIQETIAVHKPEKSFGIELLDKMHDSGMPTWVMAPLLYAYAALDWLCTSVRPTVTYAVIGFYMVTKFARFQLMSSVVSADTAWYDNMAALWSTDDYAILLTVIAYYFGGRSAKWAFDRKGR